MLKWNTGKVKNLTPTEIWLFIVARVLVGFGAGAVLMRYYPSIVAPLGFPILIVGLVLFVVAAKGLARKKSN
jgi:hypothetical protein